jgi:hypothetical protein
LTGSATLSICVLSHIETNQQHDGWANGKDCN